MHALVLRATVIALSAALLLSVGDVVLAQSDPTCAIAYWGRAE